LKTRLPITRSGETSVATRIRELLKAGPATRAEVRRQLGPTVDSDTFRKTVSRLRKAEQAWLVDVDGQLSIRQ